LCDPTHAPSAAHEWATRRTEQDHDEALARIDQLMSAKLGTPEGEELDVLLTLVDAYEAKHLGKSLVRRKG
jgi:antitoxin component HigA of HigAB toxin-antitoxin module